jgi:hypothetical protein
MLHGLSAAGAPAKGRALLSVSDKQGLTALAKVGP